MEALGQLTGGIAHDFNNLLTVINGNCQLALMQTGAEHPARGRIEAAEYLGTTQIVTLTTPNGPLKARIPSARSVRPGETVGLRFTASTLSLFDRGTGRAFRTAANEHVHHG